MALVVQGRFHAFDLARELSARGHDVTIFTNYPAWAVRRFDVGRSQVRSCWAHGAAVRGLEALPSRLRPHDADAWVHRTFGRWAARSLEGADWDVVHAWSGVAEELLRSPLLRMRCTLLMRGSVHIAEQDAILRDEEQRAGIALERPTAWMMEREEREYDLADRIVVLSSFAHSSFVRRGVDPARVVGLPLGVDVQAFQPTAADIAARAARIRSGAPLRVLYVGTMSMRKGLLDLESTLTCLSDMPIEMKLVGAGTPEAADVLARLDRRVTHQDAVPQRQLPAEYRAADVFLFATIEDGFGLVLTQAKAAGLPIICTTNCAGPDLVRDGQDGWVVPVRSPEMLADRLRWCHAEREMLAVMAGRAAEALRPRDWSAVAAEFEAIARECVSAPATRAHSA